jgi:FtsH-binding integral membrane protein
VRNIDTRSSEGTTAPARQVLLNLATGVVMLPVAIVIVVLIGVHPGLIVLIVGIAVGAILKAVWVHQSLPTIDTSLRFILFMTLVGVAGTVASLAELVFWQQSRVDIPGATLVVGVIFVIFGFRGYRYFLDMKRGGHEGAS